MARTIRDLIVAFKFDVNLSPLKRLDESLRNIKKTAMEAGGGLKGFQAAANSAGGALRGLGRGLTLGVTAPLAALGGLAVKSAIDFESAFAGVRKTVGGTPIELKAMEKSILDLSAKAPASAIDIAKIAETAGQMGIAKKDVIAFSKTMIDMGVSTNLSAEEAATAISGFSKIMNVASAQASNLGSAIVALGNDGNSTEKDIVAMALRIAGAGSLAKMSAGDVLGIANAMANVRIEAEAGGSSISRVITSMQNATKMGGQQLHNFAVVSGVSTEQFKRNFEKNAAGALDSFIAGLRRINQREKGNVQGVLISMGLDDLRVADTLKRLLSSKEGLGHDIATGNAAFAANTALIAEANERYKTLASKLAITRNKLFLVSLAFGNEMTPTVDRFNAALQRLLDRFRKLSPETRQFIVKVAAIAAVAGPAIYLLGTFVTAVGALAGAFRLLVPAAAEGATAGGIFSNGLIAGLRAPLVGAGPMLAGALIGAFVAYPVGVKIGEWLRNTFPALRKISNDLGRSLAEQFSEGWRGALSDAAMGWGQLIKERLSTIGGFLGDKFSFNLSAVPAAPRVPTAADAGRAGGNSVTVNQTNNGGPQTFNGATPGMMDRAQRRGSPPPAAKPPFMPGAHAVVG